MKRLSHYEIVPASKYYSHGHAVGSVVLLNGNLLFHTDTASAKKFINAKKTIAKLEAPKKVKAKAPKGRVLSRNYYVKLETGFGYVSQNTIGVLGTVGKLEEAAKFSKKEALEVAEFKVKGGTYAEVHYVESYVTVYPIAFYRK